MQVRSTDVVVVGGGAAGCTAALDLSRRGIDTVIVCKGEVRALPPIVALIVRGPPAVVPVKRAV